MGVPYEHKPDSTEMFFFFISGIIISIPFTIFFESVASLSLPFSDAATAFISLVIIAPIVEEFAKAYPILYRHCESAKSVFILAALVGFGFGLSEFIIYILVYNANYLLRLPAIFFHAASASIIAYGITIKQTLKYYSLAVFLHFTNNFLVSLPEMVWFIFGTLNLIVTYLLSGYLYVKINKKAAK